MRLYKKAMKEKERKKKLIEQHSNHGQTVN